MPAWAFRVAAAALLLGALFAIVWLASLRNGLLFLVAAGIGITMTASGLGFTGAWRRFIARREPQGLLATLFLLALASVVFIPALASIDGTVGNLAPAGVSVLVGALIFGIGMQLGGGCGSGTLLNAGGGSLPALCVLLFFLPGSLLGTAHLPWWLTTPNLGSVNLTAYWGVPATIAVQCVLFALLGYGAVKIARRHGHTSNWRPDRKLLLGSIAVVALAFAVLFISGRMWSITFAHALWAAKLVDLAGLPVSAMEFWTYPYPANALANSVLADVTSVTNLGLLAGVAALTLWLARDKAPIRLHMPHLLGAALGGFLMGYGARLAFGCNIGALFSGSGSASLHAWFWFGAAWLGCHFGVRLRPRFGLAN